MRKEGKVIIKFKKEKEAIEPGYAHDGDAGLDLYSNESLVLKPMHRTAIKTGIYLEIPKRCVGLIWDKSGLALKYGVKVIGGVVDSSYRGEVKVVIVNLSSKNLKIEKGMKVAQMLIQKVESVKLNNVKKINETKRGEKSFGSTGLKKEDDIKKIKEEIIS